MNKLVTILTLLLVASCSSTQKSSPSSPSQTGTQSTSSTAVAKPAAASVSADDVPENALATELHALNEKSVFFDFDKFSVKPDYQDAIQKQANFIKSHKNDVVTLEGNCDERGSKAYNLTLGGKRANTVLAGLKQLGVSGSQLKTVSNGKEKPKLLCHEEKCWKENRRVDFVHSIN